jgi:glyoxylase-like metal-dependent hydrolase (beta-lactamase superfamily II)
METAREKFNGLEVVSWDTPAAAFAANAHLIMGRKEAVLVDGLLLPSEGAKLARAIKEYGRRLKAIFVTHNHPDHYWGLEPIVREFPDARVVASKEVSFHIKYTASAKVVHWRPIFEDDMPLNPIVPEPLDQPSIDLEGHALNVVNLPPAETIFAAALYVPSIKGIFTGDLVFNGYHFYVADVNVPASWIDAVNVVKRQGAIERVYPGHGLNGKAQVLDWVIRYLEDYARASRQPTTKERMIERMKELYPELKMPELLCCTLGPSLSSDEFKVLKNLAG